MTPSDAPTNTERSLGEIKALVREALRRKPASCACFRGGTLSAASRRCVGVCEDAVDAVSAAVIRAHEQLEGE